MTQIVTGTNIEGIRLSEICQSQKIIGSQKYYIIPLTQGT